LPKIIGVNFPVVKGKESIFGHSMGGHGALTLALKNPGRFCSVSAFSPICAPSQCQWGEKVFTNYLGENRESWKKHDANELIQNSTLEIPLLIDQGGDDPFLEKELNFELFRNTCEKRNQKLTARLQSGYDHSYYFIATFMEDHIQHHAKAFFA
jgi:S-formylglutathione hydrolase